MSDEEAIPPPPAVPGEAAPSEAAPPPKPAVPARPRIPFPPLFGKYPFDGVQVHDPGLVNCISLDPVYWPHSEGKLAVRPFAKTHMHLVERLANHLMKTGRFSGKKTKALNVIRGAFAKLAKEQPDVNPLQLLVDAVENAAPREEVTRLQFGGISVPRAVDASPVRRLNVAIRNLALGAMQAPKSKGTAIADALAREIALAAKGDMNSFAVARKEEVERVAQSAR